MLAYTMSGSIYEIDLQNRQARRLSGATAPTPRTGPDGTWRRFAAMLPLNIGQRVFFEWDPKALPLGTEAVVDMRPATMTTPVRQLAGTPEELIEAAKGVFCAA